MFASLDRICTSINSWSRKPIQIPNNTPVEMPCSIPCPSTATRTPTPKAIAAFKGIPNLGTDAIDEVVMVYAMHKIHLITPHSEHSRLNEPDKC